MASPQPQHFHILPGTRVKPARITSTYFSHHGCATCFSQCLYRLHLLKPISIDFSPFLLWIEYKHGFITPISNRLTFHQRSTCNQNKFLSLHTHVEVVVLHQREKRVWTGWVIITKKRPKFEIKYNVINTIKTQTKTLTC